MYQLIACLKKARFSGRLLLAMTVASFTVLAALPQPAHAQFVCLPVAGAVATGVGSFACGTFAGIGGAFGNTGNTAIGTSAGQMVTGDDNTATGVVAGGVVTGDKNTATGNGAGINVTGNRNTAAGVAAGQTVTGDSNTATGDSAGQAVTGNNNVATGNSAGQTVTGDGNIATGNSAGQTVTGGGNIATGNSAGQTVTGDGNIATGVFAGTTVTGDGNTATGLGAGRTVTGDGNTATGVAAGVNVTGDSNTATGNSAGITVTGDRNIAIGPSAGNNIGTVVAPVSDTISIGTSATASADDAIAIGRLSTAQHANSAAFGQGATTSRDNQQVFGTGTNTYTFSGIASAASKTAQGTPTHLVTSNSGGDLAAHTFAELGLASAGDVARNSTRIDENTEGVSMAIAMGGTYLPKPGETVRLSGNWGTFEGSNSLAFSGAATVGSGTYLTGGIGFGLEENTVGGRVGASVGW